jgi:hypothetical protein
MNTSFICTIVSDLLTQARQGLYIPNRFILDFPAIQKNWYATAQADGYAPFVIRAESDPETPRLTYGREAIFRPVADSTRRVLQALTACDYIPLEITIDGHIYTQSYKFAVKRGTPILTWSSDTVPTLCYATQDNESGEVAPAFWWYA